MLLCVDMIERKIEFVVGIYQCGLSEWIVRGSMLPVLLVVV